MFPIVLNTLLLARLGLAFFFLFVGVIPEAFSATKGHPNPFEREGGFAPSIQALATTQDGNIYAGSFGLGIFFSQDHGHTWESINTGLSDKFILCLGTDAKGIVYAGTVRGGVFRTKEGGKTWESINAGLKRVEVKSILVHRSGIYVGTGRGAYRWNEHDQKWMVVATGLEQTLVSSLVMLSNQHLFVGTAGKGLLWIDTTKPGNSKWNRIGGQFVDPKEHLTHTYIRIVALGQDQQLYVGTQDGGIYRSIDLGQSWKSIGRSLPNDSIRSIVPTNFGLYVATGRGVYKSSLTDSKWISVNAGLTERAIQVMILSGPDELYAGTSAGAFRSQDRGEHWVNISEGLGVQYSIPRPFF